jgi:hypothetical protein
MSPIVANTLLALMILAALAVIALLVRLLRSQDAEAS